jgi:CheY-like chemotaxis protein
MMKKEVTILIAEDDPGHAYLIKKNLERAGIINPLVEFRDGQEILDYLFRTGEGAKRESKGSYLLLLDIRMPRVDGVEVLRRLKQDEELRKVPVVMITTTDDPREIDRCHALGCSCYITKPVEYGRFVDAVTKLGLFLAVVEAPQIDGAAPAACN